MDYLHGNTDGLKTRRRLGYTPAADANVQAWFRADNIGGLSDGDAVSTWTDDKLSNDVSNTGSARPVYKTNVQNGKPGLLFSGAQWLENTSVSLSITTACSVFLVCRKASPASQSPVFEFSSAAYNQGFNFFYWNDGNRYWRAGGRNFGDIAQAYSAPVTDIIAVTIPASGTAYALRNNAVVGSDASLSGTMTATTLSIGKLVALALYHTGHVFEVVVYNADVYSYADKVFGYLNSKWAVY